MLAASSQSRAVFGQLVEHDLDPPRIIRSRAVPDVTLIGKGTVVVVVNIDEAAGLAELKLAERLSRRWRHVRSVARRGLHLTELKSEKSRRTIALPPQLVAALKAHRAAQLQERIIAGSAWHDGDFVWCQTNGGRSALRLIRTNGRYCLNPSVSARREFTMPGTRRPRSFLHRASTSASSRRSLATHRST